MKYHSDIFDKVVVIGPDMSGNGGMASVLATYNRTMEGLRFRASNSHNGTLAGAFRLLTTMLILPVDRFKGRKIAHIHYASGLSWTRKKFLIRYARLLGFRIVSHCHSAQLNEYVKVHGYQDFKSVLSTAKVNIVLSRQWKEFFDEKIGCGNTEVVNNIVEPGEPVHSDHWNQPITFLFLGEIGERKGLFDILHALVKLKKADLKFKLIVGGNGQVERLKEMIEELDIENEVEFLGWVAGDLKKQLLSNCDVLMLPSYAEGLPISILEAMAYGLPVITTGVGGIPEVVKDGENGIIVQPGNIDDIAVAMAKYIEFPETIKIHGKDALDKVLPFYASSVACQLADLYKRALK